MSDAAQPDDGPICYMHGGRPPKRRYRYRHHIQCSHVSRDGRRRMMIVDTRGGVRKIEGSHVEDVLHAYAEVRHFNSHRECPGHSMEGCSSWWTLRSANRASSAHLGGPDSRGRWPAEYLGSGAFQLRHEREADRTGRLEIAHLKPVRLMTCLTPRLPWQPCSPGNGPASGPHKQ